VNNYEAEFSHDVIGILANFFTQGDYDDAHALLLDARDVVGSPEYVDGLWTYSWPVTTPWELPTRPIAEAVAYDPVNASFTRLIAQFDAAGLTGGRRGGRRGGHRGGRNRRGRGSVLRGAAVAGGRDEARNDHDTNRETRRHPCILRC
jgi:hypothetical protein